MKQFKLINDADGNDEQVLEARNYGDAVQEALDVLGWTLTEADVPDDEFCGRCGQMFAAHNDDGSCVEGDTDPRKKRVTITWKGGDTETYEGEFWGDLLHQVCGMIENDFDPDLIQSIQVERI